MTTPTLKPCPFCAGDPRLVHVPGASRRAYVQCGECLAESMEDVGDEAAAARWNRRAGEAEASP